MTHWLPWEMFLRGSVGGLLLFHLAHLAPRGPHRAARAAIAAFTLSVLAYLFCSMPPAAGMSNVWRWPLLALCVSSLPLLWLAARALFDDGFRFSMPTAALLLATAVLGLAAHATAEWPLLAAARTSLRALHALVTACFAGAALWEIVRGWQADLVPPRRAARRWVALGIGVYAIVVLAVELAIAGEPIPRWLPALHVAGIGLVALLLAVVVARRGLDEWLGPPAAAVAGVAPPKAPSAAEAKLLERLTQAMATERLYRQERLTLPALAQALGSGEAALRGLINQRLGYRNFNDFLHHYRLQEAAARLAAEDLPILSIALDCGYGSIGPFNRAFKQRFGMTPTQYRAGARLANVAKPAQPPAASEALRATK